MGRDGWCGGQALGCAVRAAPPSRLYVPGLDHPRPDHRRPQRVHERRERPHVVGQFLAFAPQDLDLGLGVGGADGEASDLTVGVAQRDRRLGGGQNSPCGLNRKER